VQKCSSTPCTLDLDKGIHFIKAQADGYAAQGEGTTVRPGDEFALNFRLEKSTFGTGIKVSGKQEGVELFVDGKAIGPLPQEVRDLARTAQDQLQGSEALRPRGAHRQRRRRRAERPRPDQPQSVARLASFDVRTPGVKVTLVSGKDRDSFTDFSQPVDIETSRSWTIEATKPGFDDYRQPITSRTGREDLRRHAAGASSGAAAGGRGGSVRPASSARARSGRSHTMTESATEEVQPARATPAIGACTLNFNSIPVSNVLSTDDRSAAHPGSASWHPPGRTTCFSSPPIRANW